MAGVRSAGTISGERERGTWDLLLLTPVSAAELVGEKFQGIQAACLPWLLAVALPPVAVALLATDEPFWQGAVGLLAVESSHAAARAPRGRLRKPSLRPPRLWRTHGSVSSRDAPDRLSGQVRGR